MTALIILLLAAGLILMTVEIVIIPGFGVAGILALICLGAGSVFAFNAYGTLGGIGVVTVTLFVGSILVILLMRSKAAKNLELKTGGGKSGVPEDLDVWIGKEGIASSMLRPSGTGQFGRDKLTVLTEGRFVSGGTPIKVLRVEAGKLVVEPLEDGMDEDQDEAEENQDGENRKEGPEESKKEENMKESPEQDSGEDSAEAQDKESE